MGDTPSHTLIDPPEVQTHQNGLLKEWTRTPLTYTSYHAYHRVSRPRVDVLLDSGSSVLHGQFYTAGGLRLLCTLLQNGWRHDPQRLDTLIQNYCGTRGNYRLQYTVHTCVQFLD